MSFRKSPNENRKMQLISLMDVVFILLIFFLVSIFFASLPHEERKLFIPTPENEPGYAQVLIQLIDEESFLYINPFITKELVNDISKIDNMTYMSQRQRLQNKKEVIINKCSHPIIDDNNVNLLHKKLNLLVEHANKNPQEKYFTMIRCPDDLKYASVIEVIQILSNAKYDNIQYGCLGGTLADIKNSKNIDKKIVRQGGVVRRNVVINF